MKVLASVKFNSSKAFVLDESPNFVFYRLGNNIIYGTDGIFYICYKYERPSAGFKAFGGKEFKLKLDTGEEVICTGQWWDGGYSELSRHLGISFTHITYNTIENLKNCYVYHGASADIVQFNKLLNDTDELFYYDYYDYEKILKYQDVWNRRFEIERELNKVIKKLSKDKTVLVDKVKRFAKIVKLFKNQIFINK